MTKEQQDLAWACLPKETRKEIVEIYAYHARSGSCPLTNNFELIFGKHNLISNTEPEEMLMVKRSDVQALYITAQDEYSSGEPCTIDHSQGMILALRNLFNDKCLPDKELEHRLKQISVQVESYTKPEIKDNMNKNINLCEILKGHEGETFYSIYYGNVKLIEIKDEFLIFQISSNMTNVITTINGKSIYTYELDIVPSEDQRDWIKWDKENNHKTLKTWSDLVASDEYKKEVNKVYTLHWYGGNTPIEKAVLALFKIYQLIEVSYGGNVSYERCSSIKYENVFKIAPCGLRDSLKFDIIEVDGEHSMNHIMFHTKEQAEEFLSYPENVQLLKDYFMI